MSGPRGAIVRTIFKKELLDTLRDRRTLATMLLVPMVTYPLLVIGFSEAASVEREAQRVRVTKVQPIGTLPQEIRARFASEEGLAILDPLPAETSTSAISDLARSALQGSADIVIASSATAAMSLAEGGTARFMVLFDETDAHGGIALDRVEDVLRDAGRELREARLRDLGLSPRLIFPISIQKRSVSTASEVGGHMASLYLPMLILTFIAISCFYPAIDLTAGEKERGTLATLLTAPIETSEVVLGKYFAVVSIGTIAGLINVTVVTATLLRALASAPRDSRLALPEPTIGMGLGMLAAVLLLSLFIASVMLLAATFARSFRDASNLLAPVLLALLAPAFLAALPSAKLTPAWGAVPVAGVVLWMKALLLDRTTLEGVISAIAATLGATVLLLAIATRVFKDERVLFSGEGPRADLRGLLAEAPEPGVAVAVAFASLLFVGDYFGGVLIERLPALFGVVLVQIGVHALPSLAIAAWMSKKIPPRTLIPLGAMKESSVRGSIAAVLIGLGAWLGVGLPIVWLQSKLLPGQDAASEALRAMLGLEGAPILLLLLCLAIVPAFAEELAFRGVMLGLLRARLSIGSAILIQAIAFGLLHGSVFRLLPTATLGLFLGILAVRTRSLWPGIVAHALSNGIVVIVDRFSTEELAERFTGPSPLAILGLAALAIALWLLRAHRLTDEKTAS
jgi:sodium transport system permease protein